MRHIYCALYTVFLALAIADPTAAADSTLAPTALLAPINALKPSLKLPESRDTWFNPDALDINLYGLAYHPDRSGARRLNLDNEVNPGLGLHYEYHSDQRGIAFGETGVYLDSGKNWATFASMGYQFKLGKRWRAGAALAVARSETYNGGVTLLAMIPLLTYDQGRFKLNVAYLPKIEHFNELSAFGLSLSIPFGKRKP